MGLTPTSKTLREGIAFTTWSIMPPILTPLLKSVKLSFSTVSRSIVLTNTNGHLYFTASLTCKICKNINKIANRAIKLKFYKHCCAILTSK